MSQDIFTSIDPAISGTDLATALNAFKDAVVSGMSGTSRPTELAPGGFWVDTTNDPTSWAFKIWTGTFDVQVFTIDLSTGLASVALAVDSFQVKKISDDTVGAILSLVKQRIANNGQVLSGDVVGEVRITGRTDTSGNPVVAKIIYTATDDQTTSAYGGTLSFHSTPDGTATLTEHFRFINGLFETVVPHKLNSQVLVPQNIATTASILQMSADKVLAEMTGSTATAIHGLNAAHASQVVTIHNRSTAIVTLKHNSGSASAPDRIKLPNSADYLIIPDASTTLYYCTTDALWKILCTSETNQGFTVDRYYGSNSWTAPNSTSAARIRAWSKTPGMVTEKSGGVDIFGNAFAWGVNANGQLGLGDVTPRSSPVAVLGGFAFQRVYGQTGAATSTYGISIAGVAYAWGGNTNGQLGVGDVTPRSSPVAVLGGFRFNDLVQRDASVFGFSTSNFLYSFGINTNGQLGLGDVTPRSSPVAVLGALRFSRIVAVSGAAAAGSVVGITAAGAAYAWGLNTNGNLGIGDVTPRSSPVAVLGGLTFSQIGAGAVSSRYFCVALNLSGAAYAWGANTNSNLGVGDQTPRSSPVAVLGGLTFQRLITHEKSESVFGLTSAGVLYGWGDNSQGVLGLGDNTNRSSPVAVLGGLTFAKFLLFKNLALGLALDGTLYSWGANANGQLGVGDVVARSSPVAVLGGFKFADVFVADGPTDVYSVYGVTGDGLMYAWGANTNGTLGLGDVTPRSSPIAVLGALGPDIRESMQCLDLTVAPGTSYTLSIGTGVSSFGSTAIGRNIYKVEIEYLQ